MMELEFQTIQLGERLYAYRQSIQNMTKQQMKVIAQAEHEMFCLRDLLEGSVPAKVMNRAYEYVIKQDLLSVLRETPLTHQ